MPQANPRNAGEFLARGETRVTSTVGEKLVKRASPGLSSRPLEKLLELIDYCVKKSGQLYLPCLRVARSIAIKDRRLFTLLWGYLSQPLQ